MLRRPYILIILAALLAACGVARLVGATQYTLTDLGTLSSDPAAASTAYAIDNNGDVVGASDASGFSSHAFLWVPSDGTFQSGTMTDLGTLGGTYSTATGVSLVGGQTEVAGYANLNGDNVYHAFLWVNGSMTDLGTLPGGNTSMVRSFAEGINAAGQVVGYSYGQGLGGLFRAVVWQNGSITNLGTLPGNLAGGPYSVGWAINDDGNVTGYSTNGSSYERTYNGVPANGSYTLNDTFITSVQNEGWAINATGVIAGDTSTNLMVQGTTVTHAFRFDSQAGNLTDLGVLDPANDTTSVARGINASGVIIGYCQGDSDRAFVYQNGAMTDLNTLVSASGLRLERAYGINDSGQIVGEGEDANDDFHAFLLTPVPTVAPNITAQPSNAAVTTGNSTSFTVTATGTDPLTYQWYFKNEAIATGTNATLEVSNATLGSAGNYYVVVSNAGGNETSSVVTLTVTATGTLPKITKQPAAATVKQGAAAKFAVTATGPGNLTYQWYLGAVALVNSNNVSGATTPTLMLAKAEPADAGNYTVVVGNFVGGNMSKAAKLTVQPVTPPAFITQASAINVLPGAAVSMTFRVSGTGLAYQWQFESVNLTNGNGTTGATTATLKIANVTVKNVGNYQLTASNGGGAVGSGIVKLSLLPVPQPTIGTPPKSVTVTRAGATVTFTVRATTPRGTGTLTYQWYFNGNVLNNGGNVSGATTATLRITKATNANNGAYTVKVSNNGNSITSTPAAMLSGAP